MGSLLGKCGQLVQAVVYLGSELLSKRSFACACFANQQSRLPLLHSHSDALHQAHGVPSASKTRAGTLHDPGNVFVKVGESAHQLCPRGYVSCLFS